jgi:RNA polymerase sigma-70 factor (ECF subfamily)
LYRTYAREVFRFALFLSGDRAMAEDIVSETFIRLWHARERVDLATVKAYLLAIARNLFLEQCRQAARRAELRDEHADGRPGPEDVAASRSELQVVLAELQKLPESDRAALLLRAEQGLPYDEIAALLGITPTAARVKVHRARTRLEGARRPQGGGGVPR